MEEAFKGRQIQQPSQWILMDFCWLPSLEIHLQPISKTSMDNENQPQSLWESITNYKTPYNVFTNTDLVHPQI